jgi:hypothetical protein
VSSNAVFTLQTALPFFNLYPLTRIAYVQPPVVPPTLKQRVKSAFGAHPPPTPPRVTGDPVAAQGIVARNKRELFGTFSHNVGDPAQVTSAHSNVPVTLTLNDQGPGLAVFFLPYQNDQNFRTTLVDKQGLAADLFMTDLVDGCSVYVEGTPTAPTVYHINAVGTTAPPQAMPANQTAANWAAKYARMDDRFRHDALKLAHGAHGVRLPKRVRQMDPNLLLPGKLENHNYMIMPPQAPVFEGTLAALQGAGRAPQNISGQSVDRMELLATQGTVFGVRSPAGLWSFHVQRRAIVGYYHVPAPPNPGVLLGRQWIVRDVLQFWPNAITGTQFPTLW